MSLRTRVFCGVGAFLFYTLRRVPDLRYGAWGEALLLLAAWVVMPVLLDLLRDQGDDALTTRLFAIVQGLQLGAAIALLLAFSLAPGWLASLASVPWVSVLLMLAIIGLRRMRNRGFHPVALACRDFGLIYSAVGGAWLLADRVGLRPLGFDPSIVLLTAVHFHYAGLLLPALTGFALAALDRPERFSFVGVGVIAGVPAVAIGITATQLGWDPRVEVGAALVMGLSGLAAAMIHLRLAMQTQWRNGARALWLVAGLSLATGMVLALLYGVRSFFHPFPWLDIPWMRALHGSVNALGFGVCGLLGWRCRGEKYISVRASKEKTAWGG